MFDRRGHNRPPFRPRIPGTDLHSPDVPTAIIYRPAQNPMQSGSRPRHWILEFEPAASAEIESLMGWTTMRDPYQPIRLSFPDVESAIEYAERNDWDYIVRGDEGSSARKRAVPLFRRNTRLDDPAKTDHAGPEEADPVILASIESFPASDPPAWTGTALAGR
ncbi:ETC complex I subunit [Palleronia sediminis]|uniref:ETC complex I subunit n=1 Tax=Palleronia sediminis TaxID=2547833 RepID=A0A4R5ZXA7_9RHOB|nr:NADH dehydrogenase ubiquinone Fe-S protein 4 [Palleronia sediminis]TDL74874.1 ETC complex I subunit [Palleronia sediminis]